MEIIDKYETKLKEIYNEIDIILNAINSKFTCEVLLTFDALNFNTLNINTSKAIKLIASENYTNYNEQKTIINRQKNKEKIYVKKNTRHQVYYLSKNQMYEFNNSHSVINNLSLAIKLLALFNKYKALRLEIVAEFENLFSFHISCKELIYLDNVYDLILKNDSEYKNYNSYKSFIDILETNDRKIKSERSQELTNKLHS